MRSPLHVRWPAKVRPGTAVTPIAAAGDLYPTLIDLAGVARVGDRPFDGISLSPWLLGKDVPAPDRVLFQHWAGRVSVRDQRFRLDATGQLFELTKDPGQQHNVAADHPDVAKRLQGAVARWKREVLAELPKADTRPFPVGYTEFRRTVLPARDGVPHGGVRRSAPAPNCSFFTGWTKPDDRMTWEVEVHAPGRYEAVVHYTCPKVDVGSAVELTLGKARWAGIIREAHDPPLRGKEQDRVSRRGESYVKDFRPLSLGVVAVPAGKATLTLRATKMAGSQVADVRAVELVLLGPAPGGAPERPGKPNVVLFLADDLDRADCSPHGGKEVRTPNMARLAADGVTFTHAFVASPSCAPSRAALLTGLDPMRNGAMLNHSRPRAEIKKWPAYFQDLGYELAVR